jgi:large subunit ribosomal protein L24
MMQNTRVKNPGKQRKRLFNAPAHIRHKLMAAPLSKELAASKGAKTLPVRKGDTVRIERGDNKGFEGKISRVDLKAYRIYLEGLTREKVDGTNIFISVHPSKVQIRSLNLDDKWRKNILERKKPAEKPAKAEKLKVRTTKKAEKAPAKVEEAKEEKPIEVTPVKEEAAIEVAKKQTPAEEITEEAPKAVIKKTAAKKTASSKKEAQAKEEKAPAEKKAPAKKTSAAKKKEENEAAPKAKAKKASEKGEQ